MPILSLRRYANTPIAHHHAHAQLVFGLDGQLQFEMDGYGSLITRHFLAVIPAQIEHGCQSAGGSYCLVLDMPQDGSLNADKLLQQPATLKLVPEQQQLVDWLAHSPLDNSPLTRQGAALLLASLNARWQCSPAKLPFALLDAQIDKHLAHPLQVADLARWAALSPARLHARFIEESGQTPMDYVRRRRLLQALRLLRKNQQSVGDIAAKVGYQSQSAFTAAFVREYGCSPRELRDNRKEDGDR